MLRQLPHLLIKEFESSNYTGQGAPITKKRPPREKVCHSAILKEQLANAWQEADREEVVHHTDRQGIYLEFKGEAGFELATKGLESFLGRDLAKWTRLLNVRTENDHFVTSVLQSPILMLIGEENELKKLG